MARALNLGDEETELRFRQIADNMGEAFFMDTPNLQQFLYVSPAYETIWGRTRESLYAAPVSWFQSVHSPIDAMCWKWLPVWENLKNKRHLSIASSDPMARSGGFAAEVWLCGMMRANIIGPLVFRKTLQSSEMLQMSSNAHTMNWNEGWQNVRENFGWPWKAHKLPTGQRANFWPI